MHTLESAQAKFSIFHLQLQLSPQKDLQSYFLIDTDLLSGFVQTSQQSAFSKYRPNPNFFKLVSEYPQALMYLRHCKKNCTDDLTNAINILDFYTDYHHFEFGLKPFDLVITELCNYLKSKGKTLSEIFEIVINEVAYPIGVPVDVQKFEFENIPDMETLIRAILGIYELCKGFMWLGGYSMNSDGVAIKYDETTKVISVNCE